MGMSRSAFAGDWENRIPALPFTLFPLGYNVRVYADSPRILRRRRHAVMWLGYGSAAVPALPFYAVPFGSQRQICADSVRDCLHRLCACYTAELAQQTPFIYASDLLNHSDGVNGNTSFVRW